MQRHLQSAPLALAAVVGLGHLVMAQPDPNQVAKATNPPEKHQKVAGALNGAGKLKADKIALGPKAADREIEQLEAIQGKPLTDKQKQAITQAITARNEVIIAAQKNYQTEVAQTLGLTEDDLLLKRRAYLKAHRDELAVNPPAAKK